MCNGLSRTGQLLCTLMGFRCMGLCRFAAVVSVCVCVCVCLSDWWR